MLGRQPLSRNVWWTRVNTPLDRIFFRGNVFDILRQQHLHCHHKIRTKNEYRNIPRGKKTKGMSALHNSPTDCSALAKVTALPCLVAGQAHWTSMTAWTVYSTSTPQKPTHFDGHYLHNRSTLDIGVLGYIGIVWPKEHSPEVSHIPPVTPCI